MQLIILTVSIIVLILLIMLMKNRSMAAQRFAVLEFFMVLLMVGSYFFITITFSKLQKERFLEYYARCFRNLSEFTDELDELVIAPEDAENRAWEDEMNTLLKHSLGSSSEDERTYMNTAILSRNGDGYVREYVDGDSSFGIDGSFRTDVYPAIKKAFLVKDAVAVATDKQTCILLLADTDANIPKRILCVELPMKDTYEQLDKMEKNYLYILLVVIAFCSVISLVVVSLQDLEWKKLCHSVSEASSGKSEWKRPKVHNNEMQILWNSFGELKKSIAKSNYDKYRVFQAYYRFAPKKIEAILNKASILDASNGDIAEINGILALVTMSGDKNLNRREYARGLGSKYLLLSEHQKKQDGIVLSGDCDLRNLKYMFINGKEPALQFGVDAVSAFTAAGVYRNEKALLLLHQSRFLYGIIGDEEQANSFVLSDDIDVLESYKERLSDAGVRMVVTDSMLDAISEHFTYRYIGYIREEEQAFKLYEILDVYAEKERRIRISANEKFQQGLNMYYQDDFYLARNVFADVLKECPEDGLAKWYMFACEYHLNNPELENDSYGLFDQSVNWK